MGEAPPSFDCWRTAKYYDDAFIHGNESTWNPFWKFNSTYNTSELGQIFNGFFLTLQKMISCIINHKIKRKNVHIFKTTTSSQISVRLAWETVFISTSHNGREETPLFSLLLSRYYLGPPPCCETSTFLFYIKFSGNTLTSFSWSWQFLR